MLIKGFIFIPPFLLSWPGRTPYSNAPLPEGLPLGHEGTMSSSNVPVVAIPRVVEQIAVAVLGTTTALQWGLGRARVLDTTLQLLHLDAVEPTEVLGRKIPRAPRRSAPDAEPEPETTLCLHDVLFCPCGACTGYISRALSGAVTGHMRAAAAVPCVHVGCARTFSTQSNMMRHFRAQHGGPVLCALCQQSCDNLSALRRHRKTAHPESRARRGATFACPAREGGMGFTTSSPWSATWPARDTMRPRLSNELRGSACHLASWSCVEGLGPGTHYWVPGMSSACGGPPLMH